jgi:5-methyltetrahydrofolate--homocysteine methyltransferase
MSKPDASIPFRDRLREGCLVGDGAMGTMLQAAGLPLGEAPERWNRERPEAVAAVHRAYRAAGAEVLQTNSFGGTRPRLEACGLAGELEAVNRAAVELARAAADGAAYVAGCVGPTGLRLAPGEPLALLQEAFAEQIGVLVAAGVDLILIETMWDVREAMAAVTAARAASALPLLVTLTFDRHGRLPDGTTAAEAAAAVAAAGADGVGANCCEGPESLLPALAAMRFACPDLLLVAQPSAGLPVRENSRLTYPVAPDAFGACAARLAPLARLLGGCCGTTPAHIAAVGRALARGD